MALAVALGGWYVSVLLGGSRDSPAGQAGLLSTSLVDEAGLVPTPLAERVAFAPVQKAQRWEHPRILFSGSDVSRLRAQAATTHAEIWAPILASAEGERRTPIPRMPAEGDLDGFRNAGNRLIVLAFAYVITGDPAYLDLARRHLFAYAGWRHWGDENGYGERDLGFHHLLLGSAIAYDWLYNDLSPEDRSVLQEKLAQRAQESHEASVSTAGEWGSWWTRAYIQNHSWTNHSALGVAALVLEGEDARASQWLEDAVSHLAKVHFLLEGTADGSWHEGIPYQDYGNAMMLPFVDSLRRLKGLDLVPHTYLRNHIYWRVYNSLPGSKRFALSYADFDWGWEVPYGPAGTLRFAAREYRDGWAEWMAREMAANAGRPAGVYFAPWYVFEFLYYDPSVGTRSPEELPLSRTFPDLEGVVWRTGWGEDDLVFGFKTGAPGGRFAFDRWTNGKQYPFDPSVGFEKFNTGHDHDDANSFFLYRGKTDLASEVVGVGLTGTGYHNSVLIDGQGQYRAPETFGPHEYFGEDPSLFHGTDGRLERVGETRGFSYLVGDATRRYRFADPSDGKPAGQMVDEFRRYVLFARPDYLVMVDSLRAPSPRGYEWVSHFGGPVAVEGDWVKGKAGAGQRLGVKVVSPAQFAATTGDDGKPFVRISPTSPATDLRFVTVLYPTDEADWGSKPEITTLGDTGRVTGVRVRLNGVQDHLIGFRMEGVEGIGDYVLDGRVASVAKGESGDLHRLFLGDGSLLADGQGSRQLIRAPGPIEAVEVEYQGSALQVFGQGLSGVSVYAPGVDAAQVMVNGLPSTALRDGDYLVLP